jgi:hypothetical protein
MKMVRFLCFLIVVENIINCLDDELNEMKIRRKLLGEKLGKKLDVK